jgi:hypothetical protein
MKIAVFWDVLLHQGDKNRRAKNNVNSNLQPKSSPIHVTLMMEAINTSETSILTKATGRNIPEDDILHSHCRENLKSYITLTG